MNRWCKLMSMYCSMATTNGYCQVTACKHMAEPMPICNDENAVMPYETPKVNWTVDGYIPIEKLLSILPNPYNEIMEDSYSQGYEDGWNACLKAIKEELDYWETENGKIN